MNGHISGRAASAALPEKLRRLWPVVLFCLFALAYLLLRHAAAAPGGTQKARVTEAEPPAGTAEVQTVRAVLLEGSLRGTAVTLQGTGTSNGAQGVLLRPGDTVFVAVTRQAGGVKASFAGYSYSEVLLPFLLLFAFLLLLVGGRKGALALVSSGFNLALFLLVVRLYDSGWSFLPPAACAAALSAAGSVLLVAGFNRKALAALVSTAGAEIFALLLTAAVLAATGSRGMHYDQMEFLTRAPQQVFFAQVLVGTLGGVMDIAVTMASSVQEVLGSTPGITPAALWRSGLAVGADLLATMANTVLFAYFSGSVPLILLWLINGYPVTTVAGINLSLEAVRALVGCIGIVAAVPLSLAAAVRLLPRGGGKPEKAADV